MEIDNEIGIRYALQNKYGIKIVTHTQVVIVSSLIKHPGQRAGKLVDKFRNSFSQSAVFKNYKVLKDYNVIDDFGRITFDIADMIPRRTTEQLTYPLVGFVKEKVMPEPEYEWTHIAAYIATQPNPVEICDKLKAVIDPTQHLNMLFEMQNGLAFCSVMAGDISQWASMKGKPVLLTSTLELFKKAGLKYVVDSGPV